MPRMPILMRRICVVFARRIILFPDAKPAPAFLRLETDDAGFVHIANPFTIIL
jgi:hypothetical protein